MSPLPQSLISAAGAHRWCPLTAAWLGLSLTLGTLSSAEILDEPVPVAGVPVRPMGRITLADSTLVLHPKASLGLGYDSNVYQSESANAVDDTLVTGLAGLTMTAFLDPRTVLSVDLEMAARTHHQESERDMLGGILDIGWRRKMNTAELAAGADYRLIDDPLVETGRTVKRQEAGTEASYELRGRARVVRVDGALRYHDYLDDTLTFTREQRERIGIDVGLGYGHRLSAASELGLRLSGHRIDYFYGATPFQDGTGLDLVAYYERRISDRSRLQGELGVLARLFADNYAGDEAYDDQTVIAPALALTLTVEPDTGLTYILDARSDVIPGAAANAAVILQAMMSIEKDLSQRFTLRASGSAIHREESGANAGASIPESDTIVLSSSLRCRLRRGMVVDGTIKWITQDGNRAFSDYERLLLNLSALVVL